MASTQTSPLNYDEDVDFADLAASDAAFARHYQNGKFDFHDPEAVQHVTLTAFRLPSLTSSRQLTKSILVRDFSLNLSLPPDRLCPPIPIRWSYILFLHNLLRSCPPATSPPVGLDIGTGASAIYALLAVSSRSPLPSDLRMHATEIDAVSLASAAQNIASNSLAGRITLHHTSASDPLLPLDRLVINPIAFTMCNPPFYSSRDEMLASAEGKRSAPSSVCTGSETEMICEGGDAGFVLRMVDESRALGTRAGWYTSMLGRLGSVYLVIEGLKRAGCGNWLVRLLKGGRRTRRWVVAWSWGDARVGAHLVRSEDVPRALWGTATEQTVLVKRTEVGGIKQRLDEVLGELDLRWKWEEGGNVGHGEARENVWARAARRKRQRGQDRTMQDLSASTPDSVALSFRIAVKKDGLEVRWVRGLDPVLFESFCGMLKRAMNSA